MNLPSMNKLKTILLGIIILVSTLGLINIEKTSAQSYNNDIQIRKYFVNVTTNKEYFSISEKIFFEIKNGTFSDKTIFVFVQDAAESISASISDKIVNLSKTMDGENYYINLSNYNISTATFKLDINYMLPCSVNFITKKTLYTTGEILVTLDNKLIFNSKNTLPNAIIKVVLPTEKKDFSLWYYIAYVAVIALIGCVVILLVSYLKGKSKKEEIDTPEILELKKKLLLDSLKELEKEYRSKKISDHTYTRLREEYKSQAVDVMKKLDEIKK